MQAAMRSPSCSRPGASRHWPTEPVQGENMSKTFAQRSQLEEAPDPKRRALSFGMGLLPMLPFLPACGSGVDESAATAQDREPAQDPVGSAPQPVPSPA